MHRPSGPDLAQLLQDGSWLRGFVRTLVPAQDVDDVVQTTAAGNVMLEAVDPSGREFFNTLGKGRSAADGSFEVFCEVKDASVDAEVLLHTTASAAHELVDTPPRCKWGTSGLRLEVRPLIPVRLRVTEMGTNKPPAGRGPATSARRA
jgi:hypothetical protein